MIEREGETEREKQRERERERNSCTCLPPLHSGVRLECSQDLKIPSMSHIDTTTSTTSQLALAQNVYQQEAG